MEWLNYHHLLYFWLAAKEGSVTRAAKILRLAQPTVSGQIRALEEQLGERLFQRAGRGLALTDVGKTTFRYADEIFSLGRELQDTLKGRPTGRPQRLRVGIADVLPKLIAYRLLRPALELGEPAHVVCTEAHSEQLIAQLSVHELDVVLTDAPIAPGTKVRAYNHLLGESEVSIFGAPARAKEVGKKFPQALDGAPFLMPADGTTLRRSLEAWFEDHGARPRVVGEFQDSALLKIFGQAGLGLFAAPTVVAHDICRQYDVARLGELPGVHERFYAISVERRLRHPAVVAISQGARQSFLTTE